MEANRILRLPEEMLSALHTAADAIKANDELRRQALQLRAGLFDRGADQAEGLRQLRDLVNRPEKGAAMLGALIFISQLPAIEAFYRERAIPGQVLVDTMSDVAIWMRNHRKQYGEWGLSQVFWLIHHFRCRLFRLGRLQFMFLDFRGKIIAFRHRQTGEVIAFSEPDIRYRRDGQVDGTNDETDPEGWTATYEQTEGRIRGNPIAPEGRGVREVLELPAAQWEQVLARGSRVLDIHIPEGTPLSEPECLDSYRQALAFAARFFPAEQVSAFVCTSWLLSPQFPAILPDSSNILRFLRHFYRYPIQSGDGATLFRVFGSNSIDLARAPRDTVLRRAIIGYMEQGHRLNDAGGFFLKDQLPGGCQR